MGDTGLEESSGNTEKTEDFIEVVPPVVPNGQILARITALLGVMEDESKTRLLQFAERLAARVDPLV